MRPSTPILAAAVAFAGMLSAAQPNDLTDRYLTTVQADLNGSLDTRKAAVGQQVTVTLRQDARLADYTELPRGTLLVGRILQVQAQDEQHIGAVLAISFDHAQLKDGKVVPVRCVLQGVAPVKPLDAPDLGTDSPSRRRSGGGGLGAGSGGGLGTSGGGLGDGGTGLGSGGLGGLGGGPSLSTGRSTNPTAGIPDASSGPGSSSGTGIGAGGTSSAGGIGSLPSGGAVAEGPVIHAGESLSTAPRPTAIPGVLLSTTATANASGTLVAPGRNISLASGTQITLGVIRR